MSRSNPTEHLANPAVRWFEWNGETGIVRYYDKDAKQRIDVALPFTFILLDRLGVINGWHDASASGIYSNEVKDTRQDVMVVKAFKGGTIAEGLYKDIKDRVNTAGGSFTANCYIAFKRGEGLALGSIKFKGAALGAWMQFEKEHRNEMYEGAIKIDGFTEGKKGRVTFRAPTFKLANLSTETNNEAIALDKTMQTFLSAYLKRNKREQVDTTAAHVPPVDDYEVGTNRAPSDDEIPF